jgi:hypothetical protein
LKKSIKIKPTQEERHQVDDMVVDIKKLLVGKEWGPSLAALTICIGEMGEMIRVMRVEQYSRKH